jgi:RNA polymerase sigma-70 factor (ECF subfamily)
MPSRAAPSGSSRTPSLTLGPRNPEQARDDDWGATLADVAVRQDRAAFARLFAHFTPRVKRYLMQCGSPEVQAEELAQEAMAAVWRKATLFDPGRAAASTWIFAIARNLRIDALRRRQGPEGRAADDEGAFDFDQLESDQPSPEACLETQRLNQRLHGALAQLPPEQLQVLRLSYYEDEPHARIAAELGIPLGTAKSRVRLAVAQLRRLLER